MAGLIKKLMDKARNFSVLDFATLKTVLLSAGILIGTYLSSFIMPVIWLVWAVFALSYSYLIYICFIRGEK
ncbi:MAG: hypothetical protein FWG09_03160 [Synergistaceae bacterium]|nr:hypothetical protein [Synergistaceae bacterium]